MYTIPLKSENIDEEQDVPIYPHLSDNLFDPFSEHYGQNTKHSYEYHVFISYANVDSDMRLASELAHRCIETNWRTFFAPKSLRLQNKHPDKFTSRWCGELKLALLSSFHLVCIFSPAHLRSAYCDLEIQGFLKIVADNPSRSIVLVLNDMDTKDVPKKLLPYLCKNEWSTIHRRLHRLMTYDKLRLGNNAYYPLELFDRLALTGDSWRFGFGNIEARRSIYELYVREYMVIILKGIDPTRVVLNWPMFATDEYKADALADAKALLADGIMPYPVSLEHMSPVANSKTALKTEASRSASVKEKIDTCTTHPAISLDPSRTYKRPGKWFDLLDCRGKGYPQDMDFVCRRCGYHEGVENPNDPPDACPKCGATK